MVDIDKVALEIAEIIPVRRIFEDDSQPLLFIAEFIYETLLISYIFTDNNDELESAFGIMNR